MLVNVPVNGALLQCPIGLSNFCYARHLQLCHPLSENKVKQLLLLLLLLFLSKCANPLFETYFLALKYKRSLGL